MIELSPQGLHCPEGGFHVDPHRAVERAVITHAHSDHARRGSRDYYCARSSVRLLRARLGGKARIHGIPYGEPFGFGRARLSFHPAGHILGSAQVRIEALGRVWVVSGDYKREPDPTCEPFEVVPCDAFITEATFGTPSFRWGATEGLGRDIHEWWMGNAAEGLNSVLFAYSLGKAQRVLGELNGIARRPIHTSPPVTKLTDCYRAEGVPLAESICLSELPEGVTLRGGLILAPPSSLDEATLKIVGPHRTAFASGWTAYGNRGYDHGFRMSDHADWDALVRTIRETGAREVFVLHRENGALVRHLKSLGIRAFPASVLAPGNRREEHQPQLSLF